MSAIIVDLDRTLLRTDKTLSGYTLDNMRKCHDRGIAVMVATARPEGSILQYHQQICFDAVTTMNGARIILPNTVLENGISHLSGKYILSKLMAIPDALISVETNDGIYSNAEIPEWNSNYYEDFPNLPTHRRFVKGNFEKCLGQANVDRGKRYIQFLNPLPHGQSNTCYSSWSSQLTTSPLKGILAKPTYRFVLGRKNLERYGNYSGSEI